MLLSLLPMIDLMVIEKSHESVKKPVHDTYDQKFLKIRSKVLISVLVIVIVGSLTVGYHEGVQKSPGSFQIYSVNFSAYNSTGYVDQMKVSISFHGVENSTQVFFRVFPNGAITNGNMLLWLTDNNSVLVEGTTYTITIHPQYLEYSVNPERGFMIVAYFGDMEGSYFIN